MNQDGKSATLTAPNGHLPGLIVAEDNKRQVSIAILIVVAIIRVGISAITLETCSSCCLYSWYLSRHSIIGNCCFGVLWIGVIFVYCYFVSEITTHFFSGVARSFHEVLERCNHMAEKAKLLVLSSLA